MRGKTKFLFDSDVLIRAKDFDYPFHLLPLFWEWIEQGHIESVFFSIDKVKAEICAGDLNLPDPLRDWAKSTKLAEFFLPSKPTLANWATIVSWVQGRDYLDKAKSRFLDDKSADAWLISFAMTNSEYCIITNEQPAPESRRDIKLPDVAAAMNVETITLRKAMELHAGQNLKFKK